MSAVSDFADAMKGFMDRQDAAVADLQGDIAKLNADIKALQDNPGPISPADQALLDGIQARAADIATKLDALDALTPPPAPLVL